MTEMMPMPTRVSTVYPQYQPSDSQKRNYQPWSPETSQTNLANDSSAKTSEASSCTKYLTLELFMSILLGLVVCGIPLAVMASLYVQKNNAASAVNNNTATTSSSSSTNLPSQCTSYTTNADATRFVTNTYCTNCLCDTSAYMTTGWYRFIEGAGTRLVTTPPSSSSCGTSYPGWFNGSLPSTVGTTSTGTGCINYSGTLCYSPWSIGSISVTNCDSFYVFYLTPLSSCNMRYCTTT